VGALNTPEKKAVKQFTEQERIPKANGALMQQGVVIRALG
jgi:hypothetical protein